uniref:Uncharacterized protein n=1 Tax=Arundo donax TaxID=35708 RepID=A0A0A8YUH3_ARUDO
MVGVQYNRCKKENKVAQG